MYVNVDSTIINVVEWYDYWRRRIKLQWVQCLTAKVCKWFWCFFLGRIVLFLLLFLFLLCFCFVFVCFLFFVFLFFFRGWGSVLLLFLYPSWPFALKWFRRYVIYCSHGSFVFLIRRNILNLFGFLIFWLWVYLM